MSNEIIEQRTVTTDYPAGSVQTRTVTSRGRFNDFFVSKTNQVIFAILGIINLLILLRLFLLLIGANQVGFVTFIMNLTNVFVAPFQGIFPSPSNGTSYLEVASIVAIIVYTIFAFILGMIIGLFTDDID